MSFGERHADEIADAEEAVGWAHANGVEEPIHQLKVACHLNGPCGGIRSEHVDRLRAGSFHLIAIAEYGGLGECAQHTAAGETDIDVFVADAKQIDVFTVVAGARTEHPSVGIQSKEAVVQQRRPSCHELHL